MAAVSERCGHVGELGAKADAHLGDLRPPGAGAGVSRCCRLDFVEAGGFAIASSCVSLLALEDEQLAGLVLRPVAE